MMGRWEEFTVVLRHDKGLAHITTSAETSDAAVRQVLTAEGAPENALLAVYVVNPTPPVNSERGAPMGRFSNRLDVDWPMKWWRASRVRLDVGGYDPGGAYWGLRRRGEYLYCVQDGAGNVAFFDAASSNEAKTKAFNDEKGQS